MKRLFLLLVFFVAAQASAQEYGESEDHYKLLESIDGHYIPKDKVLLREKVFREFKGIGLSTILSLNSLFFLYKDLTP